MINTLWQILQNIDYFRRFFRGVPGRFVFLISLISAGPGARCIDCKGFQCRGLSGQASRKFSTLN